VLLSRWTQITRSIAKTSLERRKHVPKMVRAAFHASNIRSVALFVILGLSHVIASDAGCFLPDSASTFKQAKVIVAKGLEKGKQGLCRLMGGGAGKSSIEAAGAFQHANFAQYPSMDPFNMDPKAQQYAVDIAPGPTTVSLGGLGPTTNSQGIAGGASAFSAPGPSTKPAASLLSVASGSSVKGLYVDDIGPPPPIEEGPLAELMRIMLVISIAVCLLYVLSMLVS
jgi:hypothetical protein